MNTDMNEEAAMARDAAARLFTRSVDGALREAAADDPRLDTLHAACEACGLFDAPGAAPSTEALPIAAAVAMEAGRHALPLPLVEIMAARWWGAGVHVPDREHVGVAARPASRPLADAPGPLRRVFLLLRLAQAAGAMEAALDLSLAHVRARTQFGRPLLRFQAVQHQLAEAAEECAAARVAADHAVAVMAASGPTDPAAWRALACAKIRSAEASGTVIEVCHQVHGAIGFTREHGLHHFTRRLMAWRDEQGGDRRWAEELGRAWAATDDPWLALVMDD